MRQSGISSGISAYLIWAMFPLFFSLVTHIPAIETLAHRIIWALVFTCIIITVMRRWSKVTACFKAPKTLLLLTASAALVSVNWGVFIYAVIEKQVLASSLGYFITPIVNVALGAAVLGERIGRWRFIAVFIACLGIGWMVYTVGELPWISLALALSWGLYGLVRKQVKVDTLTGLMLETSILCPIALVYWMYLHSSGASHFTEANNMGLLVLMGVLTSLPLLFFASAAKKLSLAALGFLGYLAPTGHFLLAVFYFNEPLNTQQLVAFILIWIALAIFSFSPNNTKIKASPAISPNNSLK